MNQNLVMDDKLFQIIVFPWNLEEIDKWEPNKQS
jgi:hypothetical protein